jgi:hypothetical protein
MIPTEESRRDIIKGKREIKDIIKLAEMTRNSMTASSHPFRLTKSSSV